MKYNAYELCEKIANMKVKDMSRTELEDYVFEHFMRALLVMEDNELHTMAKWFGVEYDPE